MEPGSVMQSLVIIFIILGFLGLVLFGIKKYGARIGLDRLRPDRELQLIESISLGPKRGVCIVRYRGKRYLLGVTDHQVGLIDRMEDSKDLKGRTNGQEQ